MDSNEKVVLDEDDVRRTLVRIAHEIVERNPQPDRRRSSASTAAARSSPGACTSLLAELLDAEVPLGDLDIGFYRDDVATRPEAPVVHALAPRLRPRRPHGRDRRRRPLHRAHGARGDRGAVRLRPARRASSSPCSPTAATASCRSAPTTSARTCPPRAASASTSASRARRRRRGHDQPAQTRTWRRRYEASALDRGPRPRRHRAHPRPRRLASPRSPTARSRRSPRCAGARAQPLLRGLDAHPLELRARRQAALRRRRQLRRRGLERREGRVAEGHGRRRCRAYEPDAIVIRSPHVGAAALVAGWTPAAVVNAGDGKHEHPTQALLDVYTLRRRLGALDGAHIWIVGDVAALARRALEHPRLHEDGRAGHGLRAADADPARDRGARLRGALRRSTTCARPTSSTRCGCSTSA